MLSRKIASGAIWLLISRFVSNATGFIGMLVIARLLTPADYGLVAVATSVMIIVSALADLPVATALVQLSDVTDEDYHTAYTLSVMRGLLVCLLICGIAWPVAHFFDDPRLFHLMLALSLYPLILGLKNSFFEKYARAVNFWQEAVIEVAGKVASFAVSVAIAFIFKSYWALALGMIATAVTQFALSFALCPQLPRYSLKSFSRIWNYAIWLGVSWFVTRARTQADQLLMGKFLPQAQLGHFSVGNQVAGQINQVASFPIMRSLFAGFSQIRDNTPRLRQAFLSSQALTMTLMLPVGFGLSTLAEPFIHFTLGEKWAPATIVLQYLAPILALNMATEPCKSLGMALGLTRTVFFINLIGLIIRLPALVIGLYYGGLIGVLIGRVASDAIMILINMMFVRHFIQLPVFTQIKSIFRPLASAAIMAVGVSLLRDRYMMLDTPMTTLASLAALASVGAVIYVVADLILWRMAGKPDGAEQKLLGGVSMVIRKLTPTRSTPGAAAPDKKAG